MFFPQQSNKQNLENNKSFFRIQRSKPGLIGNKVINNGDKHLSNTIVKFEIIFSPITQVHNEHRHTRVQVLINGKVDL